MSGLTLDAGGLIAFERNDRRVVALIARSVDLAEPFAIPAGALAQVWRDGRAQVRLARLLASELAVVVPLDDATARAAGQLCGIRNSRDVVDASVVLCAHARDNAVVTSDPDDLRRLDPVIRLIAV